MVKNTVIKGEGKSIVAFHKGTQSLITIKSSDKSSPPKPTESIDHDNQTVADKIAFWGDNNCFPNEWEEEIEKNDTLRDAIEKEIDRIYGGGIECGYMQEGEFVPYMDEDIEEFLNNPRTLHAFEMTISDYVKHRMPSPEILISGDRSKAFLSALPSCHVRLGLQETDGFVSKAYFNRNWRLGRRFDSSDTQPMFVFDPLIDDIDAIRNEKVSKYFYRVPIATHRTYYPLSPATSILHSKWLSNSNYIPIMFNYLMQNQMQPSFHLEVDEEYFESKYDVKWKKGTPEQINECITDELKHFDEMMHGVKNTGNNIMTLKRLDKVLQKEFSTWTITPFKGSTFDKGYLELDDRATLHIQRSTGIDPTLQGTSGGASKAGGGSGSDKREAFNIRMSTATRHATAILAAFYFVFNYNNWKGPNGERLKLKIITPYLQTLNQVSPSDRNTTLPDGTNN